MLRMGVKIRNEKGTIKLPHSGLLEEDAAAGCWLLDDMRSITAGNVL